MQQSVPLTEQERAVVDEVMSMQHDFDNGLREFQESIHYCIFHVCVHGSKNASRKEAVKAVIYLQDLASRLKKLEEILTQKL